MVSKVNTLKIAAASFGVGVVVGWMLNRYARRVRAGVRPSMRCCGSATVLTRPPTLSRSWNASTSGRGTGYEEQSVRVLLWTAADQASTACGIAEAQCGQWQYCVWH